MLSQKLHEDSTFFIVGNVACFSFGNMLSWQESKGAKNTVSASGANRQNLAGGFKCIRDH